MEAGVRSKRAGAASSLYEQLKENDVLVALAPETPPCSLSPLNP